MPSSASQANHENKLEMELCLSTAKWMKADLFWRDSSPSTNMTWTSMGTTNCCLCRKTGSTLRNFGNLLTSSAGRRKELTMQVVHEVCCGLDVHKKSVTACVLWASGRRRQTREFGTFTRELLELADWLRACGVTHVAGQLWLTKFPARKFVLRKSATPDDEGSLFKSNERFLSRTIIGSADSLF